MKAIPEPSLRRLPVYLELLRELREQGVEDISCTQIGERTGQDPTQIRKDLSHAGAVGKPRVGFNVAETCEQLVDFLGWRKNVDAFLVGAGAMGTALLGHELFLKQGLNIVAAFDIDPRKVGSEIHGFEIFHLDTMNSLARRMNIGIGIITTPAATAQDVADSLISCGIRGIWNFTPVRLQTPGHVIAVNAALSSSLGVLCSRLAMPQP